jgi:hypothetical protein
MRGYRWGKFQGWAKFAIGLITWVPTVWDRPGLAQLVVLIMLTFGSRFLFLWIGEMTGS